MDKVRVAISLSLKNFSSYEIRRIATYYKTNFGQTNISSIKKRNYSTLIGIKH